MTNQFARPTLIDNSSAFANPAAMYDSAGNPLTFDSDDAIRLRGEGLIAQTFPRYAAAAATVLTSGVAVATMVPLRKGQVITNVSIAINNAAVSQTLGKVGLYKKDGTRVAVTASQTTAWESTGIKTIAFTSPYTVPDTDVYYILVLSVAGTGPGLYRQGIGSTTIMPAIGSGLPPWWVTGVIADLGTTHVPGAAGTAAFWAGLS